MLHSVHIVIYIYIYIYNIYIYISTDMILQLSFTGRFFNCQDSGPTESIETRCFTYCVGLAERMLVLHDTGSVCGLRLGGFKV